MALVHFLYDNDYDNFFEGPLSGFRSIGNRRIRSDRNGEESVTKGFRPRLDLHQDKENNLMTATFELPGLKKEQVSIEVHNDRLLVSGEAVTSSEINQGGYTVRERKSGKFSRSLKLPDGTKAEHINAKMENGVLVITFPANQSEDAPHRITIN